MFSLLVLAVVVSPPRFRGRATLSLVSRRAFRVCRTFLSSCVCLRVSERVRASRRAFYDGRTHHINPEDAKQTSKAPSHVAFCEWSADAVDRLLANHAAAFAGESRQDSYPSRIRTFMSTSAPNLFGPVAAGVLGSCSPGKKVLKEGVGTARLLSTSRDAT